MKKNNLILYLFFILSLAWALLTGCGDLPVPAAPAPSPIPASPTPAGPPILRVGINAQFAPFAFLDDKGQMTGFDLDLMRAAAEAAGFQVVFTDLPWGVIFKALDSGRFDNLDLIISAITITPEKGEKVAFSQPYFNAGQVLVVKQGSDIQTPGQLDGRTVGVQDKTTGQQWVAANTKARIIPFESGDAAFMALAQGQVEAVVNDGPASAYLIHERPELGLTIIGEPLTQEMYGIAVPKDQPDLLAAVNKGLAALQASGQYGQLCQQWFGSAHACLAAPASPASAIVRPAETPRPAPPTAVEATRPAAPPSLPKPPSLSCLLPEVTSPASGQAYQIQPGDWLSAVAEREYGNPLDYRAIVDYTNQRCQADQSFTCIDNPDQVEVGWTVYLPTAEEVKLYWAGQLAFLPPIDYQSLGDIAVTGSSTVYPLTWQMAHCFQANGFKGQINQESIGTLAGFEKFCQGQVDMLNASVSMSPEYRQLCQENGREPVELQVGTDALTVVVSRENNFIQGVTTAELRQILASAVTWSEVRPDWPREPIRRCYPSPQSGTFASMVEALFPNSEETLLQAPNLVKQSEDDEELVQCVQADPFAVAFFGYAFYQRYREMLQTLPVNGIQPRPETVDSNAYPLVRPLFIYTSTDLLAEKPQLAAFVNFYLTYVKDYVADVGYFLPGDAAFQETMQNFGRAVQ